MQRHQAEAALAQGEAPGQEQHRRGQDAPLGQPRQQHRHQQQHGEGQFDQLRMGFRHRHAPCGEVGWAKGRMARHELPRPLPVRLERGGMDSRRRTLPPRIGRTNKGKTGGVPCRTPPFIAEGFRALRAPNLGDGFRHAHVRSAYPQIRRIYIEAESLARWDA
jgi:hypothetical protein